MPKDNTHPKKTIEINPEPEVLNSQCSCADCDSLFCFAKRHLTEACSCSKCKNSGTCLFYSKDNINESKSAVSSKKIKHSKSLESKENINESISQASKEIINESKSHTSKENINKSESHASNIAKVTPNALDITISKEYIKKEVIYEFDKNTNMKPMMKKQSKVSYKTVDSRNSQGFGKNATDSDRAFTQVRSVAIKRSRKEVNSASAKLSAQIMNLPYQDFKDSISYDSAHNSGNETSQISKYDVFQRIKEAYKACSCKVCECIIGKSVTSENNPCTCKPCDCSDCTSLMTKLKYTNSFSRLKKSKNRPLKFDETQMCDCKPCDCFKYTETFSKPCNCEPCQCIECKPASFRKPKTLVIAPVGEEYQHRNACQCSPCECVECGHGFGLSTSLGHEMSTGVNRHPRCQCESCLNEACVPDGNNSCRCERHNKVMRKPVERDTHDYDIRIADLVSSGSRNIIKNRKERSARRHDTITMYAAVTNTCPKFVGNKKLCNCNGCECLVCNNCKERAINAIKSSQMFININQRSCKCSPCECQVCTKHMYIQSNLNSTEYKMKCKCYVCDCINCETPSRVFNPTYYGTNNRISKLSLKEICKCSPCECTNCKNMMRQCSRDDICQCFDCNCETCLDDNVSNEVINATKYEFRTSRLLSRNVAKSHQNQYFYEACTQHDNYEDINKQYTLKRNNDYADYNIKPVIHENNVQYEEQIVHHDNKNKIPANKVSESQISDTKSFASIYKTYFFKENDETRNRNKSLEFFCNNSGNDFHNNLDQSSKITVETCYNDFMKLTSFEKYQLHNLTSASREHFETNRYKNISSLQNTDLHMNLIHVGSNLLNDSARFTYGSHKGNNYFCKLCTSHEDDYTIRKNEGAQTHKLNNYRIPLENLDVLNFMLHRDQFINKNSNQLEVSCDMDKTELQALPSKNVTYPLLSEEYETWLYSQHSPSINIKNKVDVLKIDMDYQRVQNTLREARLFSLQLMKTLEKCEKDNKAFDSISQPLKDTHATVIDNIKNKHTITLEDQGNGTIKHINKFELNQRLILNEDTDIKPVKEEKSYHTFHRGYKISHEKYVSNEDVNLDNQQIIGPIDHTKVSENKHIFMDNNYTANKRNYLKEIDYHGQNYAVFQIEKELNATCSRKYEFKGNEIINNKQIDTSDKVENRSRTTVKEREGYGILGTRERDNITRNTKEPLGREKYKRYRKIIKRRKVVSKIAKNKNCKATDSSIADIPKINPTDKENEWLSESGKQSKDETLTKETITTVEVLNGTQKNAKIVSKLNPVSGKSKEISVSTSTEIYTGQIMQQNMKAKVQVEVLNLLNMPLLQCLYPKAEKSHIHNEPSFTSCKSSCDALKVCLLGVRKVSDHTVLVKWNMPQVTTDVQGYELQVDGRAVQKFFSPHRCMAVVTCLPNCDKVLFTIRTITTTVMESGHYPSSTIVYRPRDKP